MRFGSQMEIDLSLLASNYSSLKKLCPRNEVLFMVKADAYGHGVIPIVRFAHFELGITEFGCASIAEAIHLRLEIPDGKFELYVFSDIQLHLKQAKDSYINKGIVPVISNELDLDYFLGQEEFKSLPLSLKFNTGMNRLGISDTRALEVIDKIKSSGRREIYHLLTHLSSSSMPMDSNNKNLGQLERFSALKEKFISSGLELQRTSLANSGAIEQGAGLDETHVRPGLMLYGPTSLIPKYRHKSLWNGQIISSLSTEIINSFEIKKGTPIGYGATPVHASGNIAVIALGYGDGFSSRYQGVTLLHNQRECKVVGRVNMDMAQLLFETTELSKLQIGDKFKVWDHSGENFMRLCDQSKTSPYEVFLSISARVPKKYIN